MTAITSSGSVIQVQSLVSQLMSIERLPADKLDTKITAAQTKITAYSSLKAKFSSLESAAWGLSLKSNVDTATYKSTSSDESVLKATATGANMSSVRSVTVSSLATNHSIATKEFASATAPLVTGDFELKVGETTKSISLTNANLNDVAKAINSSGADVRASVVYGTSGYRLVMASKTSGEANSISMSLSGTQSGVPSGEDDFIFGGAGTMIETVAAKDARLIVDGVTMTRSTNSITDVIPGVTLTLQKTSDTPLTINIDRDISGLKDKLQKFVDTYNDLASFVKSKSPVGTDSKGDLKGEMAITNMMTSLRRAITDSYGPEGMDRLSSVGIKFTRDGTLQLDAKALEKAVNEDYEKVASMLATGVDGGKGAMKSVSDTVKGFIANDGALGARTTGLNDQVRKLKNERADWDSKLAGIQMRLLKQYSALDASLAKMQASLGNVANMISSSNFSS